MVISDPCSFGYALNAGSISKSGQLGLQKNVESIDDCATLCSAKEYCCAFEYSDSKKWCYLNVDCNPTRDVYKDFDYCMKEAGKLLYYIFRIEIVPSHQKLGVILENKVVLKLKLSKNVNNKKCAPQMIFFNENKLERDFEL